MSGSIAFHHRETENLFSWNANNEREVQVVDTVRESLFCVKCRKVLQNPYQTKCGCRLCEKCLQECLAGKDPCQCPGGFDDCLPISSVNIENVALPDIAANRELGLLRIKCTNTFCEDEIQWRQLQDHLTTCSYSEMSCPSCGQKILIKDSLNHSENLCPERMLACPFCSLNVPAKTFTRHLDPTSTTDWCREWRGTCPFKCSSRQEFTRDQLIDTHRAVCPEWKFSCEFHCADPSGNGGCIFKGTRHELDEHYKQNIEQHLRIANQIIQYNAGLMKRQEDQCIKLTKKSAKLQRQLSWTLKLAKGSQMLLAEKSSGGSFSGGRGGGFSDFQSNQFENILTSVEDVQRAPIRATSGDFIWRIPNYNRIKNSQSPGDSVFSPPFQTREFGYKICLRAYFHGDGGGAGTHFSLFVLILRGEFDNVLQWPFPHKMTLSVLDQIHHARHVREIFRPDNTSPCFQRPITLGNKAAGCPRLITHEMLEGMGEGGSCYIKDNTVFFKFHIQQS